MRGNIVDYLESKNKSPFMKKKSTNSWSIRWKKNRHMWSGKKIHSGHFWTVIVFIITHLFKIQNFKYKHFFGLSYRILRKLREKNCNISNFGIVFLILMLASTQKFKIFDHGNQKLNFLYKEIWDTALVFHYDFLGKSVCNIWFTWANILIFWGKLMSMWKTMSKF